MQTQQDRNEPEYIVVPLQAQISMSTFLYAKYQENVGKRLDKYLTFPQWLKTLDAKPHQLEEVGIQESEAAFESFSFAGFEWLCREEWGFGAALTTSTEYSAFDLYLGIFTLIWMCKNDADTEG